MLDHHRLNLLFPRFKLQAELFLNRGEQRWTASLRIHRWRCGTTAWRKGGIIVFPRPVQAPIVLAAQSGLVDYGPVPYFRLSSEQSCQPVECRIFVCGRLAFPGVCVAAKAMVA